MSSGIKAMSLRSEREMRPHPSSYASHASSAISLIVSASIARPASPSRSSFSFARAPAHKVAVGVKLSRWTASDVAAEFDSRIAWH